MFEILARLHITNQKIEVWNELYQEPGEHQRKEGKVVVEDCSGQKPKKDRYGDRAKHGNEMQNGLRLDRGRFNNHITQDT